MHTPISNGIPGSVRQLAMALLLLPAVGFAGTVDLENRDSSVDTQDKKLQINADFETEYHEFNNLDFHSLDESSDQAILDTDDRGRFVFTGIGLELGYQIDPRVRFVLGASYRGLWGNDQIGSVNAFGGFVYFTSMYVEYTPIPDADFIPRFRVGRQRFDIGGNAGREYILSDVLDMVRIDWSFGVGSLILMPINVAGLSAENGDVTFVSYVGQNDDPLRGFRGDKMTTRYGGVLAVDNLPLPEILGLDIRAYGFYTDIGALGTGSDISYDGRLGNFSDNDWVMNYGARVSATIGPASVWGHFDGSMGVDRKELVAHDVNTNGFAWGGGASVDLGDDGLGVYIEGSYFEAEGPVYTEDGLQFSHGYVGMKALQSGGLMANRFLGWHPTSYVGMFGVETSTHDTDRKSGTRVISASAEGRLPFGLHVSAGWWWFTDTGVTALNFGNLDNIQPPFGYSRSQFEAERRLGLSLGHEISGDVGANLTDFLDLYLQGGALLPGAFYGIETARVAGTALGASDPQTFWNVSLGTTVKF